MPTGRERLKDAVERARWAVRFEWLRVRENFGAEMALNRELNGPGWRVTKHNGRRCVGTGATMGDAIDTAMRNPTA